MTHIGSTSIAVAGFFQDSFDRTAANHALQRTGSAVTAPAADHHHVPTHRQVPRPFRLSLSLGSLGNKKGSTGLPWGMGVILAGAIAACAEIFLEI